MYRTKYLSDSSDILAGEKREESSSYSTNTVDSFKYLGAVLQTLGFIIVSHLPT